MMYVALKAGRSVFRLACVLLFAFPASAGLFCQTISPTGTSSPIEGRVVAKDVYSTSSASTPMPCVVCKDSSGENWVEWGSAFCSSGDPEYSGTARVTPESAAVAVPMLSLFGTALLLGGLLVGAFYGARKRSE